MLESICSNFFTVSFFFHVLWIQKGIFLSDVKSFQQIELPWNSNIQKDGIQKLLLEFVYENIKLHSSSRQRTKNCFEVLIHIVNLVWISFKIGRKDFYLSDLYQVLVEIILKHLFMHESMTYNIYKYYKNFVHSVIPFNEMKK